MIPDANHAPTPDAAMTARTHPRSAAALFLPLLAIVAIGELGVMLLLEHLGLPARVEMFVDAGLLSLLIALPVWRLLGRPLRDTVAQLEDAQGAMQTLTDERRELLAMLDETALLSIAGPDGRLTYVNDRYCATTGWAREQLLGRPMFARHDDPARAGTWAELEATVARGVAWHGEVCERTRLGADLWTDTIVSAPLGADGRPHRYLSLRVDVTERRRAEQTMHSLAEAGDSGTSTEFLHAMARNLTATLRVRDAIIGELDPETPGRVRTVAVWSDGRPGENFGYALAGTPCEQAVEGRRTCLFTEAVHERFPEDRLLADFGVRTYVGAPLLDAQGRPIGVLAALDPIDRPDLDSCAALLTLYSERVAAELRRMRLERQVQRLSRAVESAADVVVITDPAGGIEYVNPAFTRVTGYPASDVLGRNMRLLKSGLQDDGFYGDMWRRLREGGTWYGRVVNRRKDGSHFHAALNISPLYDDAGRLSGYVGVQRDVTHLVEHERELQEARAAAESANRAKSEFLANMSHEIRTPMNGVLGMTQLLLETGLEPEQREYALTVRRSAEALLSILNDILDFSKIEAGKLTIEAAPFEWTAAVEEVVELLGARAEEKALTLVLDWDEGLPSRVVGDAGRLRQVLMNLAGNAIKFTDHGHVAIHVSAAPDERDAADGHVTLRVSVRDTGIGLAPEQVGRLFERFEQADNSNTRRFGGTGLGLAITRQLVQLMGGEVGCTSAPGEGSEFWFTVRLPVADRAPVLAGAGDHLAGVQVLVAHHDAALRGSLARLLAARGADVLEADTAAALTALLPVVAGLPAIAVVDGVLAPRWTAPQVPALLVANAARRGRADAFESAGYAGCLLPPLRPRLLLQAADLLADRAKRGVTGRFVTRQSLLDAAHGAWVREGDDVHVLPGARVLVVEDNAVNQRVALGLLKRMQCEGEVARDGREAVERCLHEAYDAVLMDCQMPVMDGYEATRRIREREAATGARRLPIIALTASALLGDREECLEAGMDDFLTKPVKVEELRAVLAHWIGRSGEHRDAA